MSSKKPAKPKPKSPPESRGSRGRVRDGALFPASPSKADLPVSYAGTLQEIKSHLRHARVRAVLAANPIVIEANWHTGKIILQRQEEAAWGAKVIDRLSADLREEFPDMAGLSSKNLLSMSLFAEAFPDGPIAKQAVSQCQISDVSSELLIHYNTEKRRRRESGYCRLAKLGIN